LQLLLATVRWSGLGFIVVLVALYFSTTLRSLWMGVIWLRIQGKVDKMLKKEKLKFLSGTELKGSVLDVGSGGGIQLQYVVSQPLVTKVVCVEPNRHFKEALAAAAERAMADRRAVKGALPLEVTVEQCTIEAYLAKLGGDSEASRVDAVTCFLVLCSIPSPPAALRLLHDRCLKPGGRLLFIEHVRPSPEGGALHLLFKAVQPVWTLLGDGCQLCRATAETVKHCAPWADVQSYEHFPNGSGMVKLPWAFGIATKAKEGS